MGVRAESVRGSGRPGMGTLAVPDEESILLCGLQAFAELGYDRASARELARRLGVSRNFINDRYGSKAAFWRAVVDHALGAQSARMPDVDPPLDDAERLRHIISDFYRAVADSPLIGRIFLNECTVDSERLDYLYECYIAPTLHTARTTIERLVTDGRMAAIPIELLFLSIIPPIPGMVEVPLARRLGLPQESSPEQLAATAETLAMLVINGLLATGSGKRS